MNPHHLMSDLVNVLMFSLWPNSLQSLVILGFLLQDFLLIIHVDFKAKAFSRFHNFARY